MGFAMESRELTEFHFFHLFLRKSNENIFKKKKKMKVFFAQIVVKMNLSQKSGPVTF